LAGQDAIAGGRIDFDGTAPVTMSWAPVASAKLYTVSVHRLYASGTSTRRQLAATLHTTETSIAIPAEVFSGGEFFAFVVSSVSTPADYVNGELVFNGVPSSFARVPTGMFRLSSLCGNNTVDTGEECDTGGASATCDVDCTFVACRDGTLNAQAGEACDHVRDSLSCDDDCTRPACGDGVTNDMLEECDLGIDNTTPGSGCNGLCQTE
jgi:cysteine-rich repeat protein